MLSMGNTQQGVVGKEKVSIVLTLNVHIVVQRTNQEKDGYNKTR
jgi:hypothetical protein